MQLLKLTLCAAAASLAMAGAASAEVAFNAGLATDYIFRGVDQTGGSDDFQVFGGADWSGSNNLYAGVWLSNTGPSSDDGLEYDIYGGWRPILGAVSLDLGVLFYGYNNSELGFLTDDFNTLEFKVAGSIPVGMGTIGAAAYFTDDQAGSDESGLYTEINFSAPFRNTTISGAFGMSDSDAYLASGPHDSYTTWNLGVTVPVTDKFSFDARYIDTDDDALDTFFTNAFSGFVGTVKATF